MNFHKLCNCTKKEISIGAFLLRYLENVKDAQDWIKDNTATANMKKHLKH